MMGVTALDETAGLEAAAIMHQRVSSLPASVTVGEVRAYFAESTSRQLAVLADGDRYAGSIAVTTLPEAADAAEPAVHFAAREPTVPPTAPADEARDIALDDPTHRLPVVDDDGRLLGIVAIDHTLTRFCGT
jgi:CBS domain-containing protein